LAGVKPRTAGPGTGPVKTGASGDAAIKALEVLKTATPFRTSAGAMGEIELRPGSNLDGKLLLYAGPLELYYIEGNDVWEAYTPDFVRDIYLTALARGAAEAEWLIPLAQAEFALIEGFLLPWWAMLGLTVLEGLAFYNDHHKEIHKAITVLLELNDLRADFRERYRTLHDKILKEALWEAVVHMPEGIGLEDVVYFRRACAWDAGFARQADGRCRDHCEGRAEGTGRIRLADRCPARSKDRRDRNREIRQGKRRKAPI
jgi:hypothetical protein